MSVSKKQVAALYVAIYNRAPDAEGLQYWTEQDVDFKVLAQDFIGGHAAFEELYGELSNEDFVKAIYQNVLGQDGDAEGIEYWTNELDNGATQGEFLAAFLNGVFDYDGDDAAALERQDYLNNRTEVALYFAATLGENSNGDVDSDAYKLSQSILNGVGADAASVAAAKAAVDAAVPAIPRDTVRLSVDQDEAVAGDSVSGTDFVAKVFDNQNTLQNGDSITGGAGHDTLYAEIGNSQNFVISPEITDVETLQFSARTTATESEDNPGNNLGGNESSGNDSSTLRGVQINGDYVEGATRWESNQSRADLVVEGVRIQDHQITKHIDVAFVDSQPGNVDFGLYFDQSALRNKPPLPQTVLDLAVGNLVKEVNFDPTAPLKDLPYDQFHFLVNGEPKVVSFAHEGIKTYSDLYAAMKAGLEAAKANDPDLVGIELVRPGNKVNLSAEDGSAREVEVFELRGEDKVLEVNPNNGWNAEAGLPASNAFRADIVPGDESNTEFLVTSNILLDNVGRGSTGGDLVVGGLSVGETSHSRGVEQFDVVVDGTSKLRSLSSTNNTLEVVNVVSGDVSGNGKVGNSFGQDLYITGDSSAFGLDGVFANKSKGNGGNDNNSLPGGNPTNFGLVDVKTVNASADADQLFEGRGYTQFAGNVHLTAVLSNNVASKYLNEIGLDGEVREDAVEFEYKLGQGNDSLYLEIGAANLAAAGTTSHSDFNLTINGGAGEDEIVAYINDGSSVITTIGAGTGATTHKYLANQTQTINNPSSNNWYLNSKTNANLRIDAGDDNDVVKTLGSGDWVIDLGAGNDVLYADNSGAKSSWIFNLAATQPNLTFGNGGWENAIGAGNPVFNLYKATVTISFQGFETKVTIDAGSDHKTSQNEINKAIADAIRDDSVLSKLLEVELGTSANSLIVNSLIDGLSGNDLTITVTQPEFITTGTPTSTQVKITAAEESALKNAWSKANLADLNTEAATQVTQAQATMSSANSGQANGSNSLHTADNTITGGAGNDVLVLGTGAQSNDVVKYVGHDNGTDSIVNFVAGAATGDFTNISNTGSAGQIGAVDFIDVSAYGAKFVDFGQYHATTKVWQTGVGDNHANDIGVNTLNVGDIFLRVNTDAAGKYTVEEFKVVTAGDVTDVTATGPNVEKLGTIGTLDFGNSVILNEFNFIIQ